jgi:hypothetical protein
VNLARIVAGILAAAATIFAVLWWRAPGTGSTGSEAAPATGRVDVVEQHAAAVDPTSTSTPMTSGDAAPASTAGAQAETIPLTSMVRSELAITFRGLNLPAGVAGALAAGRVDDALRLLEASTDGDAAVALARMQGFCTSTIGSSTLDEADLRRHPMADASTETAALLDRTLRQQREWGRRVVAGCEQAGLIRTAQPAAQARGAERNARVAERLRSCADAGNAECLAQLALRESGDPKRRLAMLQSAAVLGSVEAQAALLAQLEGTARPTPESRQAARYWREALAKNDPEYRAALLGCYEDDCDPRKLDRAAVRRELESAVRDGSLTALSHLMTSERAAAEQAAGERSAPDVTQLAPLNPSESDAYAWKSVAERLALEGCLGLWPTWVPLVGATRAAERELRPSQLDDARRLADERWQSYGRAFAAKRGCSLN